MIVRELKLERFGHFADATLPLPNGLGLLYGPNEAGKSTLLAALRAFLFGFPRGGGFDFRYGADALAVGGTLAFADGQVAELRREKKRGLKGKLGDVALSDELLKARLGKPSESLFSTVFAFSLDDLARGGDALRDEGLRAALAGAGLGAARSPQAVIEQLRQQAEALFTVKGRSGKQINGALGELKDRRRALAEAQVRGDDYQARLGERDTAQAESARLGAERSALLAQIGEKEALLRALPRRDELRGALAERRNLRPPPGLPPTAGEEYARRLEERARLDEEIRALDAKLGRVQREAEGLEVDDKLLGAAARVRPLHEHVGRHAQEASEAQELATALKSRRSELSRRLGELRPGWKPDELDVLPHPLFTNGLERLREGWSGQRERARELGELAGRRAQLESERQRLRRRLDPPWPLPANEALASPFLPVPRAEEIKQHRAELRRLDEKWTVSERDDERLQREQRELEGKRARLEASGAVPSTEELTRLRAARDTAWAALRQALGSRDVDTLADEFEAAARSADLHADELRRRSDDVAARAELTLRLGEVERTRADGAAARAAIAAERTRAEAAWQALWSRCGFAPQSPDTMLEWLGDYAAWRDADAERARLDERAAVLQAAQDDYARRLTQVMKTLQLDEVTELAAQKRVIDVFLEIREAIDELRRDEDRARKLNASVSGYREEVRRLVAEVAPMPGPIEATGAMRTLDERLRAAQAARQRRADLVQSERELSAERRSAGERRARLETTLAEWRRRAGLVADSEGNGSAELGLGDEDGRFAQAAYAARRAHELDAELARLTRALAEARGGMAEAAFDAALETADRALLEDELGRLRARLDTIEIDYRGANQRLGAAATQLGLLDGSARAAELTVGIESRRAELRGYVEQYAVVTLARALLERQVARFQERHQPAMLARLSALFAALTEGRYPRVYQRLDDEGTFVAVRGDGAEVTPAAMSTGTREQLYLAVRLAYVRHYCDAAEPLPLVLDDVLVNFDAARARATLRVLAEFAATSQVLIFTCHEHVTAMAQEVTGVEAVRIPAAS